MSNDVVKLFLFHFWLQLAKYVALLRTMSTYNHVKLKIVDGRSSFGCYGFVFKYLS